MCTPFDAELPNLT